MSKSNKRKIKDLRIPTRTINKHKNTYNLLMIITYIIFFPLAILQILSDIFEFIIYKGINLRESIVNTTFKILYRKEMKVNE